MKERITVTIDKGLLRWVDRKISQKIFANRSHAFEYLIRQLGMSRGVRRGKNSN